MKQEAIKVYLLLGSNLGNRIDFLEKASLEIKSHAGTVIRQSAIYETEPWGNSNQDNFLNLVLECETRLGEEELLKLILSIEEKLGRQRNGKWQARTIDIDILFYGDKIISTPSLTVPHPEIAVRRFVLEPLAQLVPDFIHPVLKQSIKQLLQKCTDACTVQLYLPA